MVEIADDIVNKLKSEPINPAKVYVFTMCSLHMYEGPSMERRETVNNQVKTWLRESFSLSKERQEELFELVQVITDDVSLYP